MTITNEDNMLMMARYEDNHFDLAIVDPPYGLADLMQKGGGQKEFLKNISKWDKTPDKKYFNELKRVSKNQIIWGGNYFDLPPTRGVICWDKKQMSNSFSAWEMAWTSFNFIAKMFRYDNKGFMCKDGKKIHPTQKPIKLYEWLLDNYAKAGDKILDTHLGSGSIAIACNNRKFDLTACELDTEYYTKAMERIEQHKKQLTLF